ncbi:hypothetical protein [Dickeya chrysanthemi]|uniref:hypothetical protein n=1 Tax=Dickeya chrysanthemi TaxID=556 RepID=UPI0003A1D729|nr:hypothetical protein [Dickeya chrysanthemi]
MKKALWFINQYSHPYINLKKDSVSVEEETIFVDTDSTLFKIHASSHAEALFIKNGIEILCDYNNPGFDLVTGNKIFEEAIEILYTYGYILNHDIVLNRKKETESLRLNLLTILSKYSGCFIETVSLDDKRDVSSILSVLDLLRSESHQSRVSNHVWSSENFYFISLCVLMQNAKNNNPYGFLLISEFIGFLISHFKNLQCFPEVIIDSECLYLYSSRDVEACLYAFNSLLVSYFEDGSIRAGYQIEDFYDTKSGINFALLSEQFSRDYSVSLGESQFLSALQKPENHMLLAPACYIQEYYVNYRFTETITPMISKRLNNVLRDAFARYYDEEVGHELFELETCMNLGVEKEYLETHLPLPLTQVFCDAYTYLSFLDPLSYFTSVMVTEGIPGEPSLINEILTNSAMLQGSFNDSSKEHEQLNVELGHQYLSRVFLSKIRSIDDSEQKRALHILAWMLELNHRAWEELYQRIYVERKEYLEPATL